MHSHLKSFKTSSIKPECSELWYLWYVALPETLSSAKIVHWIIVWKNNPTKILNFIRAGGDIYLACSILHKTCTNTLNHASNVTTGSAHRASCYSKAYVRMEWIYFQWHLLNHFKFIQRIWFYAKPWLP